MSDSSVKKLREKIFFFARKSTFHSIPNVTSDKKSWIVRLIWVICFVVSTFFLIITLKNIIIDYLKFKVQTIYEIQTEMNEIDFPSITICNTQVCGKIFIFVIFFPDIFM